MTDLSKHKGTLTNSIEPLIARMQSLSASDIRTEFLTILVSDDVNISTVTCSKWITAINKAKSKDQMMFTITNAYLAGSALKVA
jgi:hypothetical protein